MFEREVRHLIEATGVKIRSGPFHRMVKSKRAAVEDKHLFRVRAVIDKKMAERLELNIGKKEDWSRERSLRFQGVFDEERLVSVRSVGSAERKKIGKNATSKRNRRTRGERATSRRRIVLNPGL